MSQQFNGPAMDSISALFVPKRWSEDVGREASSLVESNAADTSQSRNESSTISLFKLDQDGTTASRV
jgi:hypothetical protein